VGSVSELNSTSAYSWLMLGGIGVSLFLWSRLARRDERLIFIYLAALAGAFLGAKLVYLGAEGWLHWNDANRWRALLTGKSVTGALLGGYGAVEVTKHILGYKSATGDWFALIAPPGIMIGRVGCVLHGCCQGKICDRSWYSVADAAGAFRWPVAQVELAFNAVALIVILLLRWRKILPGQHFHLYLMAYGVFRFVHEFARDTPAIVGPISGYQIAALGLFALGFVGFERRRKQGESSTERTEAEESRN
jgi:phosphatidylglycerol:prolipoprotein diacylglycerol transferase